MSQHTDTLIQIQRHMAWERAKAELNSMLCTFYPKYTDNGKSDQFDNLNTAVSEFIDKVEADGLHE